MEGKRERGRAKEEEGQVKTFDFFFTFVTMGVGFTRRVYWGLFGNHYIFTRKTIIFFDSVLNTVKQNIVSDFTLLSPLCRQTQVSLFSLHMN